jgi:hypothetical protein
MRPTAPPCSVAVLGDLLTMAAPRGPRKLCVGTAREHTGQYRKVIDVLVRMRTPLEFLALGDFVYPDNGVRMCPRTETVTAEAG